MLAPKPKDEDAFWNSNTEQLQLGANKLSPSFSLPHHSCAYKINPLCAIGSGTHLARRYYADLPLFSTIIWADECAFGCCRKENLIRPIENSTTGKFTQMEYGIQHFPASSSIEKKNKIKWTFHQWNISPHHPPPDQQQQLEKIKQTPNYVYHHLHPLAF